MPGVDAADRLGRRVPAVACRRRRAPGRGPGRYGASRSDTATGPAPGPPPPWGTAKVLCRFMCTMSKPMSPGRVDAEDGVEVGAVVVEQPAHLVHGGGDLGDVLLEQAERVRVGEHDAGHVVVEPLAAARPRRRSPRSSDGTGDRLVAAEGDRRRVGAVGRVGDDAPWCAGAPCVVACHARISSRPVSSPDAPAGGCRVAACMPVTAHSVVAEVDQQLQPALGAARPGRPGARWPARAATRRRRRASGCTSWCRSPAGRRRGRRSTAGASAG